MTPEEVLKTTLINLENKQAAINKSLYQDWKKELSIELKKRHTSSE
ncbi:hypothetical protein CIRG_06523 [Coccidioides immitis RMSCC 2394]|uniref:Uncharacterized protein n=1 Tax=Coccidioides immitis RMSCC 2394 TaxID=404692 RepID=A0A0J7B9Y3_COCIT|nr:hypothetical protein CIRG_06523 [Coccidioides immitis RMSCC 2394]